MLSRYYTETKYDFDLHFKNIFKDAFIGFFALTLFFGSFFTVLEGHIGIKKRFGEAISQVGPGLHFKFPYIESVSWIEVRTRKNEEKMPSSSAEQMPVGVHASVNWTVDKTAGLELYRKYGGLDQFESRILDPRFRSTVKAIIPHYTAEQLIQDRSAAISGIEELLTKEMAKFPVMVDNVQIENIVLPEKYLKSIETKQTEKNLAAAEEHKLARQALTAEQAVNTAKAEAEAIEVKAIAEASAIEVKGLAEAAAIKAKAKALRSNPLIVKLTEAQQWDGKLPVTMMGDSATPIMDMRAK